MNTDGKEKRSRPSVARSALQTEMFPQACKTCPRVAQEVRALIKAVPRLRLTRRTSIMSIPKRLRLRSAPVKTHQFSPRLESIEDRMLLATFTVANLNDAGAGSLRQALIDANAAPG